MRTPAWTSASRSAFPSTSARGCGSSSTYRLPGRAWCSSGVWRPSSAGGRGSSILLGVALFGPGYVLEAAGIVTKRIEESGFELPHLIRAGLEESVELAGWILVAAGLAAGMLAAASRAGREAQGTGSRP
jgi:hypothetical protein